ncbi:MAG: aminotransferase class I/II-fold pyridoxal phosphate-dependent enzyme [Desulfobacterales bacterium]|nr:MAG: aminotransferase class I/II-fold pyridoxal phosphate-dependent enzyme [Desulfobacterales bacterium]
MPCPDLKDSAEHLRTNAVATRQRRGGAIYHNVIRFQTNFLKIKGYYDYGIFAAIQAAGIVALRGCDAEVDEQVEKYQQRREILCEGLEKMGWSVNKPQAGMFVWVEMPDAFVKIGSMQFAIQLMQEANVAVAPGKGFGEEGENYLRLALVENEHRTRQALRQMRRALPKITQRVESGNIQATADLDVMVPD